MTPVIGLAGLYARRGQDKTVTIWMAIGGGGTSGRLAGRGFGGEGNASRMLVHLMNGG